MPIFKTLKLENPLNHIKMLSLYVRKFRIKYTQDVVWVLILET